MTEIEKMYENAGIKGEWRDYRTKNGKIYEGKNPKNRNIRLCKPDFTAEKQLELIKWLSTKELKIRTNKQPYAIYIGILGNDNTCFFGCEGLYFEQTLAEVINNLWQDLTDQEKEEIRNILNA